MHNEDRPDRKSIFWAPKNNFEFWREKKWEPKYRTRDENCGFEAAIAFFNFFFDKFVRTCEHVTHETGRHGVHTERADKQCNLKRIFWKIFE